MKPIPLEPFVASASTSSAIVRAFVLVTVAGLLTAHSAAASAPVQFEYLTRAGWLFPTTTNVQILDLNERGDVIGSSASMGMATAWITNRSGRTHLVGIYDDEHTQEDGRFSSFPLQLNKRGELIGQSDRRDLSGGGMSAWWANARGVTRRVGILGPKHTSSTGRQVSRALQLNKVGQIIGISEQFQGSERVGQSAWLEDTLGSPRKLLGLFDAAHTWVENGVVYSDTEVLQLTDTGYIIGSSWTRGLPTPFGSTAWVRTPAGHTHRLGIYDAPHTGPGGVQRSEPIFVRDDGWVLGASMHFPGSPLPGEIDVDGTTLWVTRPGGPLRVIGLYDAAHTGPGGFHRSEAQRISKGGWITGNAYRFDTNPPGSSYSQSAWLADLEGNTRIIGIYDAAHRSPNGAWRSGATIHDNNLITGAAAQYGGTLFPAGWTTWLMRPNKPLTRVGLYDAAHTAPDGTQNNSIFTVADNGWVVGATALPNGGGRRTVWVASIACGTIVLGEEVGFTGSGINRDGVAWVGDLIFDTNTGRRKVLPGAQIRQVVDGSGVVYGVNAKGRPFVWVPGAGRFGLIENVDIELADEGWASWGEIQRMNGAGYIVGEGTIAGTDPGSEGVFVVRMKGP